LLAISQEWLFKLRFVNLISPSVFAAAPFQIALTFFKFKVCLKPLFQVLQPFKYLSSQ